MVGHRVLDQAHQLDDTAPAVRSVFFIAGPAIAGSILPAVVTLLDAADTVSPARAVAPAKDPRSWLTR